MNIDFNDGPELTVSKLRRLQEDLWVTQRAYRKACDEFRALDVLMTSTKYKTQMDTVMDLWHQLLDLEDEIKKETPNE